MIVLLDANAILSDPHFKHPNWQLLVSAVKSGSARVFVPSVVVSEVCHHYPRMRAKVVADLEKSLRLLRAEAQELVRRAVDITTRDAAAYEGRLRDLLDLMEFDVLPPPDIAHDVLAQMALARKRPFDDSGTGYRDALVWMTLLELMEDDPGNDYALVSMDRRAFDGGHGQLHPDLLEQARELLGDLGSVQLIRSLAKIPIPGKYRGQSWIPPIHEPVGDFILEEINRGHAAPDGLKPSDLRLDADDLIYDFDVSHVWIRDLEARELSGSREVEMRFSGDAVARIFFSRIISDESGSELNHYVQDLKVRLAGTVYTAERGELFDHVEDLAVSPYESDGDGLTPLEGLDLDLT